MDIGRQLVDATPPESEDGVLHPDWSSRHAERHQGLQVAIDQDAVRGWIDGDRAGRLEERQDVESDLRRRDDDLHRHEEPETAEMDRHDDVPEGEGGHGSTTVRCATRIFGRRSTRSRTA